MPQSRSEVSARETDAPVISGLACRVPGARGTEAMWRVLSQGQCTVTSLRDQTFDPALYLDPFQNRRGKAYTLASGQLDGIFQFDANFFGISPREAAHIDPQQRLMLQTVWEAIEDAGLSPRDLAGERTGVFVGSSIVENLSLYYADTARSGSSFSLGNTLCIIANRVSSFFDFGGPSYVLDAACASSLYALHQASEAIRTGQVDTAIVGGVHALLTPGGFVGFSQARMLSPTGLCRAFDASADGYVRSEACVALVLQSPRAARRMMARTRARVLATGANTDGAASQLTVPSSRRQESLMDAVMLRSGRDPEDLAFYEAHGTGTQVGDPVEARSIGQSMAVLRRAPLLVGSAKTNFGHAEPAAGLIGVAKLLLALQHRALPASLHFTTPNPNIDFAALNLEVNTALRPLPDTGALLGGVNSFGFGGTNVSTLIESDGPWAPALHPVAGMPRPAPAPAATSEDQRWLLLSAASGKSLTALARAWAARLEQADPDETAALAAAAAARADLPHRLALPLTETAPALLRGIGDLDSLPDEAPGGAQLGLASFARSRTVLAFPGNGAQVPGMGVPQYRDDPVFRAAFDEVAEAMEAEGVADLTGLMHAPDLAQRMASPLVAQPLLFGFQVALARSLCRSGLRMDAVIGHSVGEIAALHVAGCFDLAAAARIIVSRSRAFERLRGKGGMAVVAAAEADVARAISGLDEPDLAIAAVNSPRSVTVAGPVSALSRLARVTVAGKRLAMVRLKIEIPYHSPQVDALRQQFLDDLAGIRFAPAQVAVGASAIGRQLRAGECNTDYLWRNARDTVRFSDALTALTEDGPCQVVEIAPIPVIQGNIRDLARYGGAAVDYFLPLDGKAGGQPRDALIARAWCAGVGVAHEALAGPRLGPAPQMPLYPWDEVEFRTQLTPDGLDAWGEEGLQNLVGRRADRDTAVWITDVTPTHPAWVADHKVGGNIVLAGAMLAELALGAASELWPAGEAGGENDGETVGGIELRHFDILAPTVIEGDGVRLRTRIDTASGTVTIQQRPRLTDTHWLTVARGVLRKQMPQAPARAQFPRGNDLPVDDLYDFLTTRGLAYGPAFRRMSGAQSPRRDTVWIRLTETPARRRFVLDPTALDGAFHGLAAVARGLLEGRRDHDGSAEMAEALREGAILLPTRIGRLHLIAPGTSPSHARLQVTRLRRRSLLVTITLHDAAGAMIAQLDDAEFTVVRLDAATRIPATRLANRRIRLRSTDQPVRLPRGWSSPRAVLARLGAQKEPAETALTATLSDLRAAPPASQPGALDKVLRQAPDLAPDLADDLRALMIALGDGDPRDTALYGFGQRQCWAGIRGILGQLVARWPGSQRLNLLLLGLPDVTLLRQLPDQAGLDRVAVSAADAETRSLLSQVLPTDLAALIDDSPKAGSYDLILAVGDAARHAMPAGWLAPGGLALMLDLPDLAAPPDGSTDGLPDDCALPGAATGFLNGPALPLRLRVWRAPATGKPAADVTAADVTASDSKETQAPRPLLLGDLPPALPAPLTDAIRAWPGAGGKPSHRVLLHLHRRGDVIAASLTDSLMTLKTHLPQDTAPLVLLAVDVDGDAAFPVLAAGLRSAVVTAANEFGDRPVRLLVLHHAADPLPQPLSHLIGATDSEIALHAGPAGLEAERLIPLPPAMQPGPVLALRQRDAGRLDSLEWRPAPRPRLRAGEVEIEVAATGLNFRDVMSARGLLSERILDAGASGAGMGMECAGVVRRCGAGVRLRPGARVMGFARSAFASHLVLPEHALSELPQGVPLEAAAGLPVAFVTAWEALCNLARLAPNETVLIHGGAGGVGLAAIQIARAQGARVLATAGTEEKRALARAYGADEVFNSRDLSFAGAVMAATGGRGVDVVLNSLYGEAMQRSVECLAPFGRFVELGKRDYLEGTQLDLRPFARNLTYFGVDLDQRLASDPARIAGIMDQVRAGFAGGSLRPVPVTVFGPDMTEEAFRHMLAARHTGKIVIRPAQPGRQGPVRRVRDAWVIIGGTGGVGLEIARWLLAQGASRVHLLSRSGDLKLGLGALGRWARGETRLSVHAVDGGDAQAMTAFLRGLDDDGQQEGGQQGRQRVGGVIHAAMVLRDRLMGDLDKVEVRQVIDAKYAVAETLAELLRQGVVAPDHVLFLSSVAAHLGNPGQASYSAANAAMEALAAQLRDEGHPALAIGWGAINDSGYLTRNAAVAAQLSKMDGVGFLRVAEVITELARALHTGASRDYCLAPVNWSRLAPMLPALQTSLFAPLVPVSALNTRPSGELVELLKTLDWPAALAMVEGELRTILSGIMRMPPDQFDPNRPFSRYGLDSLMALELRMEVERRLGTSITSFSVTEDMTAARLAAVMVERIKSEAADIPADTPADIPANAAADATSRETATEAGSPMQSAGKTP